MTGTGILKSFDFNGKDCGPGTFKKTTASLDSYWGYASSPLCLKTRCTFRSFTE